MSIIIHFNTTSFLPSSVKLPSAPSIIKAKTKLAMVPGIDQTDRIVMTDDENSMVDIATSNTLYTHSDLKSNHVLSSCFGLPYQDHNYGAPPPPTPPSYSPCPSPVQAQANGVPDEDKNLSVVSSTTAPKEETTDASITRCICGFEHDDEYMICCDKCLVWQHVDCMGLDRNNIPETYLCEKCQPRKVDRHKAKILQARKSRQVVKLLDSSETEDDTEVKNAEKKTRTRSKRRRKAEEKVDKPEHHISTRRSRNLQKHKERIEAKRSRLRRTKNKESTSTADEEAQDAWEISQDWCEKNFETAIANQYTPEVQQFAKTLTLHGYERKFMELLVTKSCKILDDNPKRLISIYDIPRDQPLIEYVGKFLLASQFRELHPAFSKKLFPFAIFYTVDQEEICVDSSVYGNDARFVRRSCKPNAELRHLVYNGLLHLYISSTKAVFKDDEITLPIDFSAKESLKEIECACESDDCILKLQPKNGNIDTRCPETRNRKRKLTFSADDDSSQSFLGSNSSPTKSKHGKSTSQTSDHTDGKSENESEDTFDRKKKTREERKIDAIMRAFDQMEKAAKRRQQAIEKQKTIHPKSEESFEKIEPVVVIKEEEKPIPVASSEIQCPEEEKVHVSAPKPRKGKRRRCSGSALSRRRTRTNSGGSDIVSLGESQLKSEPALSSTSGEASNVASSPEKLSVNNACATIANDTDSAAPAPSPVLKTKRFLLHEWLQEKSESNTIVSSTSPVTSRSELKWTTGATSTTYSKCTKYNPNSGGISAAHLRRSSTSGQLKSLPTKSCGEQGSAKKRWLRQAMYDCPSYDEPLSIDTSDGLQLENGCFSPNGQGEMGSPGASDDPVTPLKKRRLMRESVDSANSPLSPSSHNLESSCPVLSPVDEEIKDNRALEAVEQLLDSGKNLSVDFSSSNFISPINIIKECSNETSKLCIKEEKTVSLLKVSPKSKLIIETENISETASLCKELKPPMQKKCDSVQSECIPSSNNVESSDNVYIKSVSSLHVSSDKNMQSNQFTHQNCKTVDVSDEDATQSISVKRKIVFPNEQCSLPSSSVKESRHSNCSDSSDSESKSPALDKDRTSDTNLKQSYSKCENMPEVIVNKNFKTEDINISPVNFESTSNCSTDSQPLCPEMNGSFSPVKTSISALSGVKNKQTDSCVETSKNCLTDISPAESNSCSSNNGNSLNGKSGKFSYLTGEKPGASEIKQSSATQKRKVSLSEYRKRMQECSTKRSNCETVKGSSSTAIPKKLSESVTLAPLPLFDTATAISKSPSPPAPVQTNKKKKESVKIEDIDDIIEHRENLTERLKREFGFDDDSGGCTITSTANKFNCSASTLPVAAQPPPPPPPPPPPRHGRPYKGNISITAPAVSPSQFGYPVPTHYARPSYIVPQVPGAQFIPVPQAVTAPVIPSVHPITPPVVPPLLPTPHSYPQSMPGSVLQPPMQQHEYLSVNAQSYAALVQQTPPPPPPKTYNHVYQPSLYK